MKQFGLGQMTQTAVLSDSLSLDKENTTQNDKISGTWRSFGMTLNSLFILKNPPTFTQRIFV